MLFLSLVSGVDGRKRSVLLGLFLLLILGALSPGKVFPGEADKADVAIDVENSSPVKNENVAQARNDAIQGALQKAVEQATADLLSPGIMGAQAKILKRSIFLKGDQYIQNYRITSEKSYAGMYTVIVRVTVALDGIKKDLRIIGLGKDLSRGVPAVPVAVTIRGIKSYQVYSRFREFLKTGLKGVEDIHDRSIAWGTASVEVDIPGGGAVLAAEFAKVKQFPITTTILGNNYMEVVFER